MKMKSKDDIGTLVKDIGLENVKRLQTRWRLRVWRNSFPHNWFIENLDDKGEIESFDATQILPNLHYFEHSHDSAQRVIQYFGGDSGMPVMTTYKLKRKYRNCQI